jgi:hypothetical protein
MKILTFFLSRDVLFITHFYNTSPFFNDFRVCCEKSRQGQLLAFSATQPKKKAR